MNVDAWHVDGHTRARCLICGEGTTDFGAEWLTAHKHPEFTEDDRQELTKF